MADNRVAGNRATAAREADHHAFGGIDGNRRVSRAGARLEFGIRLQQFHQRINHFVAQAYLFIEFIHGLQLRAAQQFLLQLLG